MHKSILNSFLWVAKTTPDHVLCACDIDHYHRVSWKVHNNCQAKLEALADLRRYWLYQVNDHIANSLMQVQQIKYLSYITRVKV